MASTIERLIEANDWLAASRAIRMALHSDRQNHWLLTSLALTYYEEKDYRRALEYDLVALAEAPTCPLVLWNYAGTLQMIDQRQEALKIYRALIRRGTKEIAFDDCGEGLGWARGLVADCHYRIAGCHRRARHPALAIKSLEKHLGLRGPGCRSIYQLRDVKQELEKLRTATRR